MQRQNFNEILMVAPTFVLLFQGSMLGRHILRCVHWSIENIMHMGFMAAYYSIGNDIGAYEPSQAQ